MDISLGKQHTTLADIRIAGHTSGQPNAGGHRMFVMGVEIAKAAAVAVAQIGPINWH